MSNRTEIPLQMDKMETKLVKMFDTQHTDTHSLLHTDTSIDVSFHLIFTLYYQKAMLRLLRLSHDYDCLCTNTDTNRERERERKKPNVFASWVYKIWNELDKQSESKNSKKLFHHIHWEDAEKT